jgi:hypothetical protein
VLYNWKIHGKDNAAELLCINPQHSTLENEETCDSTAGVKQDAHGCESVEAILHAATVAIDNAVAQGRLRLEYFNREFVEYS